MESRQKKIIGVIPARRGATRFPNKPLALIQGKPMIQWVIEGAKKSKILSDVFVATDDQEIFQVSERSGAKSIMTDSDLASGTDRIYHATKNLNFDVVINIQGDEPLIQAEDIDTLAEIYLKGDNPEMATLAHDISEVDLASANAVKVITNKLGDAIYFSRFPIPHSRLDAKSTPGGAICLKHVGLYAYTKNFLKSFCEAEPALIERAESLEQLRALYLGARIRVLKIQNQTWGIDTPEDLARLEEWLEKNKKSKR